MGRVATEPDPTQAVEDWLHTTFHSWWTMHGVRAIMGRIYDYAEGHGLWEEGKRTPVSRAKLGKKRHKYELRILRRQRGYSHVWKNPISLSSKLTLPRARGFPKCSACNGST